MIARISRVVFYLFLVLIATWVFTTRLPKPGNRPQSELASFAMENTFTTVWNWLRKAREAEYRGDYYRNISSARARSAYKMAQNNCKQARDLNQEKGFLNTIIKERCWQINRKLDQISPSK